MRTIRHISAGVISGLRMKSFILPLALCLTGIIASAQGYYDDDLYYDAAKAKKEAEQAPKKTVKTDKPASGMYYYDGAAYVPWDSVGDFRAADTYYPTGGSTRDVDEYNRHGGIYATEMPDSISLQDFEQMSATEYLARFGNSQVAKDALAQGYGDNTYTDYYNAGYANGYDAGYNSAPLTSVSLSFAGGMPYYYSYYPYSAWGYPYYSWPFGFSAYDPMWNWGYYNFWNLGWGWTTPSWSWGWGWPGPGYWASNHYRPSPPAAHRPRPGGIYNGLGGNNYYGNAGGGTRPGYRPPATGNTKPATPSGGYYGGSSSGRNSHYGTGYTRPSAGSATSSGTYSGSSNRGNFGTSQSTRGSSAGSSSSGSHRSSGSYSGGSSGRSGGSSGSHSGGTRSGGGGHRSR